MAIVLGGARVETPGLETVSWLDDPAVPKATDGNPRRERIRAVVLHTVKGIRGKLLPGSKPSTRAEAYAKYQANTSRDVSWDYTIDTDGTIVVSNDPIERYTWQAGSVNPFTLGIEMVQEANGDLYADQMAVAVRFLDLLTRELSKRGHPIQRAIPWKDGKPVEGVIARLRNEPKTVAGIYGHRNQTDQRGPGDPGNYIFEALAAAGYQQFDYDAGADLAAWRGVQAGYRLPVDGIPGIATRDALIAAGYPHGLLVRRPGD